MIARYSTEKMSALFALESRFEFMKQVEIECALVQADMGLIPKKAALDIKKKSKFQLARILEIEKTTKHDVIAFVSNLAENVGPSGRYIHYGLTSSDVLDTALSLQINEGLEVLKVSVVQLQKTLIKKINEHKGTICAGRTHGIYAEITTFGFKLAGYLEELKRNTIRVERAQAGIQICKLSGAVGTSSALPIDFEAKVAKNLKLKVEPFATQVIPRDRHAEVLLSLALLTTGYERLAVELRHLQRSEVSEVIEGFTPGQKGSSAMPHKKNPISAENITGLARLMRSYSQAALENISLWHERDISHSSVERVILPDAFQLAHYMTLRLNDLIAGLFVDKEKMLANTQLLGGVLYSSHLLLHLVEKKNKTREDAYMLVQRLSHGLKGNEHLSQAIQKDSEAKKLFSQKELDEIFSGQKHLKSIQGRLAKYLS
ncbi:MAG: adenylosuccinate lyase [Bdellovibrionaceae bacterium]|nr:adenylosuccinate lyase [Bdellovibrio sp.]